MEEKNVIRISLKKFIIITLLITIAIIALIIYLLELSETNHFYENLVNPQETTTEHAWTKTKEEVSKKFKKTTPVTLKIPKDLETVTEDVSPVSYSSLNDIRTITCKVPNQNSDDDIELEINIDKFNIPKEAYDYKEDLIFRVTYSLENNTVYKCEILDLATETVIENLSEDNFIEKYDVEYNKEINKMDWTEEINLSEIEEGKVYEYISVEDDSSCPRITNNSSDMYIVYHRTIDSFDWGYEKTLILPNEVRHYEMWSRLASSLDLDESYRMMYKKATLNEALRLIDTNKTIYISNCTNGEYIDDHFEDYIYNDTDYEVTLTITDSEEVSVYTLEPHKIYEYDWMIDTALIEY